MPGDKITSVRPNAESNQRFDLVEFNGLSITPQNLVEAVTRALLASPKASAGTIVGERWVGSITANPTPGDGLVRVDSTTFVGVDSDGGLVLKPNGVALSASIPSGGSSQQVYLYMKDVSENTQVRRKLPATAPFNEFPASVNTDIRQVCDIYVRAGTTGSIVTQDAIGTITYPLLFLGIAVNTAGDVVFTPAANTLETVTAPSTIPATNVGTTTSETTVTGGSSTLRDLLNTALYKLGINAWKGSDFLTPGTSNNFGAYQEPAGGVDKAFRQALGYVTVGNGTTIFGDVNTNAYANNKLMFDAAIAALPATGGVIHLKRGITLSGFGGVTIPLPAGKTVEVVGDHSSHPSSTPQITFAANEGFAMNATGLLVLRNLHISHVTPAVLVAATCPTIRNVRFDSTSTTDQGAAIQSAGGATEATGLDIDGMFLTTVQASAIGTGTGVRTSSGIVTSRCRILNVRHETTGRPSATIDLGDIGDDVEIGHIYYKSTYGGVFLSSAVGIVTIDTTDNTTKVRKRYVHDISADTIETSTSCVDIGNVGWITIERLKQHTGRRGIYTTAYAGTGPVVVKDSYFDVNAASWDGAMPDLTFESCYFGKACLLGGTVTDVGTLKFVDCTFKASGNGVQATGTIKNSIVVNCRFEDIGETGSSDFAAFRTRAPAVNSVDYSGNTITSFQNVAYGGVDSTTQPRVFEVDANSAVLVRCSRNTVNYAMTSSSGNARASALLLDLSSEDRASDASFGWLDISITDNELQGYIGLMRKTFVGQLNTLNISRNSGHFVWNPAAGPVIKDFVRIIPVAGLGYTLNQFRYDQNNIDIDVAGVGNFTFSIFALLDATGATWSNASLQGNQIYASSATPTWTFATAGQEGFYIGGINILNLTVLGNSAGHPTTSGTERFRVNIPATVTRTVPSGGKPSVGVAWGSNNLIFSGG